MNKLGIVIVTLLLVSLPLYAIDSLQDLLKKGADAEKKREKDAKKAGTAASFSLTSGERVKDVQGTVLSATPATEVVVHTIFCGGGYCKPTVKVIQVPAWPDNH